MEGEDVVRERAIKFMSNKVHMLPEDILTKDVEDFVVAETQKVMQCILCSVTRL